MIYTVKRINEDLDFGCEERTEGTPTMVIVSLTDHLGKEFQIKAEDAMLYERNINEGDRVYFDEKGKLDKGLDEDWTKTCTTKTVDTIAFVNMMQAVKAGKKVNWNCPFCGGNVVRMKNENGNTVIGCEECDMRINLESQVESENYERVRAYGRE